MPGVNSIGADEKSALGLDEKNPPLGFQVAKSDIIGSADLAGSTMDMAPRRAGFATTGADVAV